VEYSSILGFLVLRSGGVIGIVIGGGGLRNRVLMTPHSAVFLGYTYT